MEIELQEEIKLQEELKQKENRETCTICLNITELENVKLLPCNHEFC